MLILMLLFAVCLQLGVTAGISRIFSVPMQEITIGLGPGMVVIQGPPRLKVGLFPGGYVQFIEDESGQFVGLTPALQLLIFPAGPIAVWAAGAVLLGPMGAFDAAIDLFSDLALAFQSPADVLDGFHRASTLLHEDALQFFGFLLSKVGFFNLLPLATLPIGQLLARVLPAPIKTLYLVGSMLLMLGLFLAWGLAGIRVAWG